MNRSKNPIDWKAVKRFAPRNAQIFGYPDAARGWLVASWHRHLESPKRANGSGKPPNPDRPLEGVS